MSNYSSSQLAQTVAELPALVNNLLLLLSDKEKVVIRKRFSLEDSRKHTLDEIGKEFSVTRERIRQIEKNALTKMRRNVFNTALKHLHEFSTDVLRKHNGLVKEEEFHKELSEVLPKGFEINENNVHLSLFLNDKISCVGNTINFYPYVRENNLPDYSLKHVSNHLINQLEKYQDVKKLDKVFNDLKSVVKEVDFDLVRVKSLINIDKRILLLDDELVGLLSWRHIHPRTLRDKILYILRKEKNPMHFVGISDKISDQKFDNRSVNVQAVHNELIRHDQFVLIGRGIYALNEWGYEKGTVAEVVEDILKSKKEMSQTDIISEVLKQRKVKQITIVLALKNNNKFERTGRKMYRLRKK